MANPGPVAGVDYAVPTNFLNPGQRPDAPLVAGVAGNIHFVKKAADADYGAFVAQHYQLYPDGSVSLYNTIQAAITAAAAGDRIYVVSGQILAGGTDPVSYAESLTIPAGKAGLQIVGIANGPKQAAQPQVKSPTATTACLTVRSPGCLISGITVNGGNVTGGGILLDDDGSTKTAMGTIIQGCVLKNCVGSAATDGSKGGAVMIGSTGGAWDTLIRGCLFYNNIGGIVLLGTSDAVPQDIEIDDCRFDSSTAAGRDVDIWGHAGSGMVAVQVNNCNFGIFPAAGTKNIYYDLTGCTGIVSKCNFAAGSKTYGAGAVSGGITPTTVGLCGNYQDGALIART